MAKALSFPRHKHPPSTRDPKFMLRFGAFSNDQGSEGEAVAPGTGDPAEPPESPSDGNPETTEAPDAPKDGLPSLE